MSGGYFNYKQHTIADLEDEMDKILERMDKSPEDDEDDTERSSLKGSIEDEDAFKASIITAKQYLKIAKIYTQRIDYFLSGDDGEESFHKRLKEDLENGK